MTQRDIVALICALVFVALIAIAVSAIKRRAKRQQQLGSLPLTDQLSGVVSAHASGFYVSTVYAEKPLDRIVSHGLMHRGKAEVRLRENGIEVQRLGETSFAILTSSITDVSRASATIDRGVEQSGLLAVSWMLGNTEVTTNFRLEAAEDTPEFFKQLSSYNKGTGANK